MRNKLITLLTIVSMAVSSCYDDTALLDRLENYEQRLVNLENLCQEMNTNITSLQALIEAMQNNDCITSITPVMEGSKEVGYVINFAKQDPITIYYGKDGADGTDGKDGVNGADGKDGMNGTDGKDGADGKDGHTPEIGVKKDTDGVYYWTLDGEWLCDADGNKIKAVGTDGKDGIDGVDGKDGQDGKDGIDGVDGKDGQDGKDGITPSLKIEEGYWYVSYDGGMTWRQLYKAVGADGKDGSDGKDGDSFFRNVVIDETAVTFILSDGQTFTIPMYRKINIILSVENNETTVKAGETITISYQLENATDQAVVIAASDGNYKVKVRREGYARGVIEVTCPDRYVDGFINITVADGNGNTYVKTVSFSEKRMSLHDGYELSVAAEGGLVSIPFTVNFDYTIKIAGDASSWISVVETKAYDRYENLDLSIARNDGAAARKGVLYVYANNNTTTPYCKIAINQASAVFSFEKTTFIVAADGEELTTAVESSCGLAFKEEELPEWLNVSASLRENSTRIYDLKISVTANTGESKRSFDIPCYSDDKATRLGAITVIQLENGSDGKKDLVFKVRANFANDFTSVLPIGRSKYDGDYEVDCYVDWGDGTIEHVTYQYGRNEWGGQDYIVPEVKHKYEGLDEGKTFEVRISGVLEALQQQESIEESIDRSGITEVVQWGNTGLRSLSSAFRNNKTLTTIPTDETFSFVDMEDFKSTFQGCSNLQTIPADLFKNCKKVKSFYNCFSDCDALTSLPAGLFSECESLESLSYCFSNCDALTSLPAGLFSEECASLENLSYCFSNCDALTTLPNKLFDGCANVTNCNGLFKDCDGLTSIPEGLFSECASLENLSYCFSNCDALTTLPNKLFDGCANVTNCNGLFNGCAGLTCLPSDLFFFFENATRFNECFNNCKKLQSVPSGLFSKCTKAINFSSCFSHNESLVSIPSDLFANCSSATDFSSCFYYCTKLTSIPTSLFDDNRRIVNFYQTFFACRNVTGESPYTVINGKKIHLYERESEPDYFVAPLNMDWCFYDCSQLSDYQAMPDAWKGFY